jgi:hypothetical protein
MVVELFEPHSTAYVKASCKAARESPLLKQRDASPCLSQPQCERETECAAAEDGESTVELGTRLSQLDPACYKRALMR